MKKYRLIKEYPGSPKLGTEFDYWTDGISEQVYNKSNNPSFIPLKTVKAYPEFWQEVVEKDYEILELRLRGSDRYKIMDLTGHTQDYIESLANCDGNKIYSIKRISDNSIFTVGDDVLSKTCGVPNKILSIELINNKIRLYPRNSFYNLEDISKVKQKLLTTEDGVDIFKGSKYFTVYTMEDDKGVYETWKTQCHPFSAYGEPEHFIHKDVVYFSAKEAAEEYILMNKPCLSLKELYDCIDNKRLSIPIQKNHLFKDSVIGQTFKELIKQKLKT